MDVVAVWPDVVVPVTNILCVPTKVKSVVEKIKVVDPAGVLEIYDGSVGSIAPVFMSSMYW